MYGAQQIKYNPTNGLELIKAGKILSSSHPSSARPFRVSQTSQCQAGTGDDGLLDNQQLSGERSEAIQINGSAEHSKPNICQKYIDDGKRHRQQLEVTAIQPQSWVPASAYSEASAKWIVGAANPNFFFYLRNK